MPLDYGLPYMLLNSLLVSKMGVDAVAPSPFTFKKMFLLTLQKERKEGRGKEREITMMRENNLLAASCTPLPGN